MASKSHSNWPGKTPASDKPILVELHQSDRTKEGYFGPAAHLKLRESFRTGGLLSALPAEDLKSFMYLLTFVSPNGNCGAAIHQLCAAMQLSGLKVRRRMQRLVNFHWAGGQLVVEYRRESGMTVYAPHPSIVAQEHIKPPETGSSPIRTVPREAVIAHSRQEYGTPRMVVEKAILDDWYKYRSPNDPARPKTSPTDGVALLASTNPQAGPNGERPDLLARLEMLGLTNEQATSLVRHYDHVRIERQLQWLPLRNARNPAGYLLAAVADNYEAPLSLRRTIKLFVPPTDEPATNNSSSNVPNEVRPA